MVRRSLPRSSSRLSPKGLKKCKFVLKECCLRIQNRFRFSVKLDRQDTAIKVLRVCTTTLERCDLRFRFEIAIGLSGHCARNTDASKCAMKSLGGDDGPHFCEFWLYFTSKLEAF